MGTDVDTDSDAPDATTDARKSVSRRFIVNKLNYLNFQNRSAQINLKHVKYDNTTTFLARPLPCSGERLECAWVDPVDLGHTLKTHAFFNLLIPDDQKLYLVTPKVLRIDEEGLSLLLPETGSEAFFRKIYRHPCFGIAIRFIQNSIAFSGILADFNPISFRVTLTLAPDQTFRWIDPEITVTINLLAEDALLYSGECRIIRHGGGQSCRDYVLEPLNSTNRRRFHPKQYRSTRQELLPAPNIVFRHPLTDRNISLKVVNLSGSGFSVEEDVAISVLLPGLIITEVELDFAGSFRISCMAQVVYRNPVTPVDDNHVVRCGFSILAMGAEEHVRLMSLLQQASSRNFSTGSSVDMDALWNFFFATGFIYPEKYSYFETNKEEIKNIYKKLYGQSPHIARHFIYQDRGVILGHMAMLRFFENSWLIHHHAANREGSMTAGVAVLNQIGRFVNDSYNILSMHMDYVLCYFRPNNKFPDRVFGGFARNLKAPRECSLDNFAYFHVHTQDERFDELPSTWSVENAEKEDLLELACFYRHHSNGLLLDALDLKPDVAYRQELVRDYQEQGFRKERQLLTLRHEGVMKAFAMVNIADVGLNMSNLTNCPTIFVLDEELDRDILYSFLSVIATRYADNELPVLLYPETFAKDNAIVSEKQYTLWILDLQYLDHYFGYLERLIKHIQH